MCRGGPATILTALGLCCVLARASEPYEPAPYEPPLSSQLHCPSLLQSSSKTARTVIGPGHGESDGDHPVLGPYALVALRHLRQLQNLWASSGMWKGLLALVLLALLLACLLSLGAGLARLRDNPRHPDPGKAPSRQPPWQAPSRAPSLVPSQRPSHRPSQRGAAPLCPGLVVPEGCECTLQLPRAGRGPLTIDDAGGQPVFRALLEPGRLTLASSAGDGTVFAAIEEQGPELRILYASRRPFGTLRARAAEAGGGFEIADGNECRLRVRSFNDSSDLTITDGQSRLLALVETVAERPQDRIVRIGPHVDAGLIVLAILGAELLFTGPGVGSSTSLNWTPTAQQL
mmetsp:Transcript_69315/g.196423  ORF Transcript_69315/g.196423 Transcript_69315/m.196423 type:complete len:345 (+) Transcript_69315:182-1216(+)